MHGYIKLHRKIMDSAVWSDPYYLKLWMYCLMKATHKEREVILGNQVITLKPGQFITGRNSLAEDLNKEMKPKQRLAEKTWYRYMENLERWQMLTIKKTNKYSVISILKWNEYQESDHQKSIKSPSDDQQMSTNKNVKNVKNDNNIAADPAQVYEENFGILKPILRERFIDWCNDLGDEIAIAGMKLAAQKGGRTFGYIEEIWKEWYDLGLNTLDQVRAHEKGKANRRNNVTPLKSKQIAGTSYDPTKDRF